MENTLDRAMYFSMPADGAAPQTDPREARYQLAERLVDNICYGEAQRILETLGDYRDSAKLLEEVRALRNYQDIEEAKLKEERRRQIQERERKEALAHRRRVIIWSALGVIAFIALLLIR